VATIAPRHRALLLFLLVATASALGLAVSRVEAAGTPLRTACGARVVIQTDWFPEPEHGALYELAGTGGSFDSAKGRYTGTLQGVQIEIRAGGPFAGFQAPITQMYEDPSITLGYVSSDEAIRVSKTLPTVAVVAPLEFSPQILMWNPQKLTIKRFADIATKYPQTPVVVFAGVAWVDYLVGRGWVDKSQVDTSYDGAPGRFVAADGGIIQQGFVTTEPFLYEHELPSYHKPVSFLFIKSSGYVPYPQALAVTPTVLRTKAACLKLLVPLIQRAQVAYLANPRPVNAKLEQIVTSLNTFWKLTPARDAYNVAAQRRYGIVQNGPNCTLGDFNLQRLQGVIDDVLPIYERNGLNTYAQNLKAGQIATNRFIDPSIHLRTAKCR
jgi:hypothetical protein